MIDGPNFDRARFSFNTIEDAEQELQRLEYRKLILQGMQVKSKSPAIHVLVVLFYKKTPACCFRLEEEAEIHNCLRAENLQRAVGHCQGRNREAARLGRQQQSNKCRRALC
jgi:hypothetical protein